jgi:erythromycin esterase-like protein
MKAADGSLLLELRKSAHPLQGEPRDYDPLLERIGSTRFVLIGEASHGTREFYRERALITRRLIAEKGFSAVAVEADWPDAYRVNRFVRGESEDTDATESLAGFERFPTWMWRNKEVVDFVSWLRRWNDTHSPNGANKNASGDGNGNGHRRAAKVGFYGLDLYSLFTSIREVLSYLDKVDPEAARRARYRYSCFQDFAEDSQAYGYIASFDLSRSCEQEVVSQLSELQRRRHELPAAAGRQHADEDEHFFAEQNARLIKNAEEYYRSMFRGRVSSWNLRDRHMADTLDALDAHLNKTSAGDDVKIVVWEHNSHLGDARATEMGERGELNVGQLVRQRHPEDSFLIGLTTHSGTVTAASDWDAPAERKRVRPGLPGSYEDVLHQVGLPRFLLHMQDSDPARAALWERRLERAIGVIYRPETERLSHYFFARLPEQFDAVLHFDRTSAVEPLEIIPPWHPGESEEWETFPSGM